MKDELKIDDKVIILDNEISRRIFSQDAIGREGIIIENGQVTKLMETIFGPCYTVEYKYGLNFFPADKANECVQKIKD